MNRTVYFADRAVAFTAEAPGGAWYAVAAEACGGISRAKILNFLESHNSVAVVSDDPDRLSRPLLRSSRRSRRRAAWW